MTQPPYPTNAEKRMHRLKDYATSVSIASVLLGLGGTSVIAWTHPENRLPDWGIYFLISCLTIGGISFFFFAVATSWIAMNRGLAGQASSPSSVPMMQPAPQQEPINLGRGLMLIVGRVMGVLGGLGLMYFGFHQMTGKLPFPFTAQVGAKGMAGLCTIVMGLGYILISRSSKKSPDSDADAKSSETKPNPNL